jgi:hypothetical protein
LAEAFGDLERRVQSSGALPEGDAAALNLLFSGISKDHDSLPTVMSIAAQLGLQTRNEPEAPVPVAVPTPEENRLDLQSEEWLVFAGQPEPPKRHWSLIASVAITVVVTWLALQTVPQLLRRSAPSSRVVASATKMAGDVGDVRPELSSGSLPVAEAATAPPANAPPATAPDGKANPLPPQVTPPAAGVDSQSLLSTSGASGASGAGAATVTRPVRAGTTGTQSSGSKSVKNTTDSAKAAQLQPGNLFISTRPWGYLYLDGLLIGTTPANDVSIAVGAHRLRVVREGFRPYEAEITVLPGQRIRLVDIILSRQNP